MISIKENIRFRRNIEGHLKIAACISSQRSKAHADDRTSDASDQINVHRGKSRRKSNKQ